MYEHFIRLRDEMDVVDVNGEKVGNFKKLSQPAVATSTPSTVTEPTDQPYLHVDTGFLHKDLYIPANAVSDVISDRVILNMSKDSIDAMGWDHQPDFLRD
jgi:hypothetical protein